ncbi:family 43 glycosylhydrolase [Flagellimonas sp. 389]|uniref:family 43 glycosylhydrolase n=1 Tax=Flagellimonas sp. 389 TaxID=2835862 RepID=UPI002022BDD6|nr:family 43 glycosylhydrolase [Flagellimonas sp. 389]
MQNKKSTLLFSLFLMGLIATGQNPIVPNKGLNDPHIHIFKDTAYVYASHDKSIENKRFIMEDWWVWSSPDLVNWTHRSTLKPEETYIRKPFEGCWATDVGYRNGKYYWYFSERNQQTGVMVADSPTGPWSDPLGEPLLKEDLTPTDEYDMAIFEEDGEHYIIFGVWDYYIAKLNYDMISLAEIPKKIEINNPRGPYNQDGKNTEKPTDDKPFVHKYKDKYYLSWGCFYAISDNLYGPYNYIDTVIKKESFVKGYEAPTWPNGFLQGRHGSFFEWHNQWYYTYCDISQTGNRWFRDTFISYVHYKDNGKIATIRVDGIGVANYNADQPVIEAEDYFKMEGMVKKEYGENGFIVATNTKKSYLNFPNIKEIKGYSGITFTIDSIEESQFSIEIRRNQLDGEVLASKEIQIAPLDKDFTSVSIPITSGFEETENLYFLIHQKSGEALEIDNFKFYK